MPLNPIENPIENLLKSPLTPTKSHGNHICSLLNPSFFATFPCEVRVHVGPLLAQARRAASGPVDGDKRSGQLRTEPRGRLDRWKQFFAAFTISNVGSPR